MKSNISSAANCLIVDTLRFNLMQIRKREHKLNSHGSPKKTKQIKS